MTFVGTSEAGIINLGAISAFDGDVYLFAKTVDNAGNIVGSNGRVGLAAGTEILLRESGKRTGVCQSILRQFQIDWS